MPKPPRRAGFAPSLLSLEAISFRAGDPLPSAPLPLRIDSFRNVPLPEWQLGRNKNAEDSPVLYVKSALETNAVSILGQLHVKSGGAFILKAEANKGAIFGDIKEFRVDFAKGKQQFVSIPLDVQDVPIGVDMREQIWSWSFRPAGSEKWTRLSVTKHKIFVILDSPGSPWLAAHHNSLSWPWTTALEQVCGWAKGAATPDEATAQICRELIAHSKGPNRWFEYQLKKSFNYFVEHGYLQFQQMLASIQGDPEAIHIVNCVDAASLVVTFANLIGARLKETVIDRKNGRLSPTQLLPLGSNRPQLLGGNGFGFHEIALSEGGDVWDICFKLRVGDHFEPSIKVPFSEYTSRLLGPEAGQLEILRRPHNFMISPAPLAAARYFGAARSHEQSARAKGGNPRCFIRGFFLHGNEIPGWKLVRPRTRLFSTFSPAGSPPGGIQGMGSDPFVEYSDTMWLRRDSEELMRVETYVTPSDRYAISLAIRRGTEIGEDLKQSHTETPNEVSFFFKVGDKKVEIEMRAFSNVMCFPRASSGAHKKALSEFQQSLAQLMLTQPDDSPNVEQFTVSASGIEFKHMDSADYWWKFFCPIGSLNSQAGRLMFNHGKGRSKQVDPEPVYVHGFAMAGREVVRQVRLRIMSAKNSN